MNLNTQDLAKSNNKRKEVIDQLISTLSDPRSAERLRVIQLVEKKFVNIEKEVSRDVAQLYKEKAKPDHLRPEAVLKKSLAFRNQALQAYEEKENFRKLHLLFDKDVPEEPIRPKPKILSSPQPLTGGSRIPRQPTSHKTARKLAANMEQPVLEQPRRISCLSQHILPGIDIRPQLVMESLPGLDVPASMNQRGHNPRVSVLWVQRGHLDEDNVCVSSCQSTSHSMTGDSSDSGPGNTNGGARAFSSTSESCSSQSEDAMLKKRLKAKVAEILRRKYQLEASSSMTSKENFSNGYDRKHFMGEQHALPSPSRSKSFGMAKAEENTHSIHAPSTLNDSISTEEMLSTLAQDVVKSSERDDQTDVDNPVYESDFLSEARTSHLSTIPEAMSESSNSQKTSMSLENDDHIKSRNSSSRSQPSYSGRLTQTVTNKSSLSNRSFKKMPTKDVGINCVLLLPMNTCGSASTAVEPGRISLDVKSDGDCHANLRSTLDKSTNTELMATDVKISTRAQTETTAFAAAPFQSASRIAVQGSASCPKTRGIDVSTFANVKVATSDIATNTPTTDCLPARTYTVTTAATNTVAACFQLAHIGTNTGIGLEANQRPDCTDAGCNPIVSEILDHVIETSLKLSEQSKGGFDPGIAQELDIVEEASAISAVNLSQNGLGGERGHEMSKREREDQKGSVNQEPDDQRTDATSLPADSPGPASLEIQDTGSAFTSIEPYLSMGEVIMREGSLSEGELVGLSEITPPNDPPPRTRYQSKYQHAKRNVWNRDVSTTNNANDKSALAPTASGSARTKSEMSDGEWVANNPSHMKRLELSDGEWDATPRQMKRLVNMASAFGLISE